MYKDINLLQENQASLKEEKESWLGKSFYFAGGLIALFILVLVGVFYQDFKIKREMEETASGIEVKEQEINKRKEVESLYILRGEKVKGILKIMGERVNLVPLFDFLEKAAGFVEEAGKAGIQYESLQVVDYSNLQVSLRFTDTEALDKYVSILTESNEAKSFFKAVKLGSVNKEGDGGYVANINFLLKYNSAK